MKRKQKSIGEAKKIWAPEHGRSHFHLPTQMSALWTNMVREVFKTHGILKVMT